MLIPILQLSANYNYYQSANLNSACSGHLVTIMIINRAQLNPDINRNYISLALNEIIEGKRCGNIAVEAKNVYIKSLINYSTVVSMPVPECFRIMRYNSSSTLFSTWISI